MRILPGPSDQSVEYAKMIQDAGCSILTVHGRTRFQRGHDTGLASWDVIRDIKRNLDIPVIANGNVLTFDDALKCLKYTGADAVMSAEGLLHNPALFTGTNPFVWEIAREYLNLAEVHNTPVRIIRNHMYRLFYLCIHQDNQLRSTLEDASSIADFHQVCTMLETLPQELKQRTLVEEQHSDDLDIGNLFSSCLNFCDTETVLQNQICDPLEIAIVDEVESNCNLTDHFLPIWRCHARPRIPQSGNRGCYSKYFSTSVEMSNKEIVLDKDGNFLSKKQQRKARHYAKVLAAAKENRKAKKSRKKQKMLELKQNCEEERAKSTAHIPHKEMKLVIRQRLLDARSHAPKVCIDLSFSTIMANKELTRLSTQLRRLYGANRQSSKPFHLYFCNFGPSDPLYGICTSKNDGFSSYIVDMTEHSPEELFPTSDIIFLSPDAENVLHTLNESKVYVIGGIIDDTIKKNVSLNHAQNLEIQTARLPICEYLKRCGSGTTVLTVNQVFEILVKFYETGDWVFALTSGVPARKGFKAPAEKESIVNLSQIVESVEKDW